MTVFHAFLRFVPLCPALASAPFYSLAVSIAPPYLELAIVSMPAISAFEHQLCHLLHVVCADSLS